MAIYHFSAKVFTRSEGHSSVAKAAYRAGEKITDEREADLLKAQQQKDKRINPVKDYSHREGVVHSNMLTPSYAPEWAKDRGKHWNEVERVEDRSTRPDDAQLAREVELSLMRDLSMETNIAMVEEFARQQFVALGMVADVNVHNEIAADGGDNPHAHIMLTMRDITPEGFGNKNRDWNRKALLNNWRKAWADHVNGYLEAAGLDERIDHRKLVDQGVHDRIPENMHPGPAYHMENRGIQTENGDRWRDKQDSSLTELVDRAITLNPFHPQVEETNRRQRVREWIEQAPPPQQSEPQPEKEIGHAR